ncbi:MAG: tRNA (N6-threonylcarbamoyladenosine(37)-N6)-methyltransferase TrmO [Desulfobulbaceae bacterium]|nr:tRNA (N6-threonylcarbamoyladenosine(37)-N6)-methyltransferase TrmO [Desulfobulbaceae bacterium]
MPQNESYYFSPIGYIQSCFKEKFGVARQSMMIPQALGVLKLNPDPAYPNSLNHLKEFSHLWIIFVFHKNIAKGWKPLINPPRLEAPKQVGVFASRSPHRPNPLGMSAVKLEKIDFSAPGGIELHLSGLDILDGTPVLDIKPYLSFADSFVDATLGWASQSIQKYRVEFSSESITSIHKSGTRYHPNLQALLQQMLELDPRPTSQRKRSRIESDASEGLVFAFRIFDFDVKWKIHNKGIFVMGLEALGA